jgi:hypothetical protein
MRGFERSLAMRPAAIAAFVLAALVLAGCQVNVDNQSRRNADHAADSAGAAIDKAADRAGKAIDKGAKSVEKAADSLDAKARRLDVHVNLPHGDRDDGNSAKAR